MKERIAIVDGVRTPFCKAGTSLARVQADDLGAFIVKELMSRTGFPSAKIDELIFGNVGSPAHAANIARVVALKAGLAQNLIAYSVHRNCASGMESITTAANKILSGNANVILAGGTESMSNYPLLFGDKMTSLFGKLMRAKTLGQKLSAMSSFRPSFLKPKITVMMGLTDPVCGLNMGQTAEVLAREFAISREKQDEFALNSHLKAAQAKDLLATEIAPFPVPPGYQKIIDTDNSVRPDQSLEALSKLRPYFDRVNGTVTAANACPLTDGAGAVLLMKESQAKEMGLNVLGYLKEYAYAGLEPNRMGLGPVYATSKVLDKAGMKMSDMGLVEMNEAFAAQIIANLRAFESDAFAKKYLAKDKALGEIDLTKFNIYGGAIAIGHPVGVTGTRLVLSLLKQMKREKVQTGLATLCIGGGQGAALILESE
jgi:acetyl-CoA C-acetyltransferase/acetyl-CoA acyltransferase